MSAIWTAEALFEEVNRRIEETNSKFDSMMAAAEDEAAVKLCVYTSTKTIADMILDADKSKRNMSQNLSGASILSRKRGRSPTTEDEGYMTEESRNKRLAKSPTPHSKTQVNFSNKTLYNGSIRKLVSMTEKMSRSRFKTPGKGLNKTKYGLITPKAAPNRPLAMMRRPTEGEMAVSLCGSPLYVSNISNDKLANVNIPFANGKIISLLPTHMGEMDPADLPRFDPDTKKQIKMLAENLNKIVQMIK